MYLASLRELEGLGPGWQTAVVCPSKKNRPLNEGRSLMITLQFMNT